ncbi:MAG TPA: efflux RND transporter periplasmic adaptor subunit [Lacunisphaera sp.]|nr:efflux RND transporter periplasmic adaptor subunit [Lacunisphaera sp.]
MHRLIILLGFGAILAGAGCRRNPTPGTASSGPPVVVQTAVVVGEFLPTLVEVPATVRPVERAVISAKVSGTVSSLPWGLGQEVKAGEILAVLAMPETEARVRQAQAQLAEAERAAARERTLVTKGVNAPDALRDAEDRLRFAQAGLAEAEAMLAHATIRAPFTGVVTEKQVLPGDLATPGLPLLVLESSARLRAEGTVPESAAARLHLGDRLGVVLVDAQPPIFGAIEELSTAADAVSRSVLLKVALPPHQARSGQFARLQVETGSAEAIRVPAAAVSRFGQIERVFVVTDGRANLRLVKSGRMNGDRLEIVSGLNPGEQVVLASAVPLTDGQAVTPAP